MMFKTHDRRHRPGIAAIAALALLTLAACGENPTDNAPEPGSGGDAPAAAADGTAEFRTPEAGSGDGLKLGLIALGDSAVPFSKLVTDSMKEQAAAAGAELLVCDSALDGAKALACAQSFKTQGVQGYLNFQVDATVAEAICRQGPDVPVIAIDIEQKPCQDSFMGANNQEAGAMAGEALGTYFKEEKNCEYDAFVSMEQPAAGAVNEARMGGYREGFESVCGPIANLRKVDGGGAVDSARTKFTDVLTSLPDAKTIIVVGINDDSILGALAAAKTAGRGDEVFLSGQGADPSAWCEIKNNPNWVVDTAYFPERYGEIGIPYLIDAVEGKTLPPLTLVPHQPVTSENISEFYPSTSEDC